MTTYKTMQGDTWDEIAFKFFGDEGYMQQLIEANFDKIDYMIFPANVELKIPTITVDLQNNIDQPSWRQVDSEGEALFSESDLAVENSEE